MRLRMTVTQRSLLGAEAAVRARTARQKRNIRAATPELAQEEFDLDQGLAPRRTNFLADHMEVHLTETRLDYVIGFFRKRFVGQENPVTKKIVTHFYAWDVIRGNRRMAGNDFLSQGAQLMRRRKLARYRTAIET